MEGLGLVYKTGESESELDLEIVIGSGTGKVDCSDSDCGGGCDSRSGNNDIIGKCLEVVVVVGTSGDSYIILRGNNKDTDI